MTYNDENKNVSLDLSSSEIKNSINKVIDYFINFSLETKNNPTIADIIRYFNITTHILLNKLGGIKYISNTAKNKYLFMIIDDSTIENLKLYKNNNNNYPTRNELIKTFISKRQLTKIGYVLKCKKVIEYIYKYVDKRNNDTESDIIIKK